MDQDLRHVCEAMMPFVDGGHLGLAIFLEALFRLNPDVGSDLTERQRRASFMDGYLETMVTLVFGTSDPMELKEIGVREGWG